MFGSVGMDVVLNQGRVAEDIPLKVIDVMFGNSTDVVSNYETVTERIPLREADLVFTDSSWYAAFNIAVVAEGRLLRDVGIMLKEAAGPVVLNRVIIEMATGGRLLSNVDVTWTKTGGNVVSKVADAELVSEGSPLRYVYVALVVLDREVIIDPLDCATAMVVGTKRIGAPITVDIPSPGTEFPSTD
jgi:hypothetical protein